MVLALAIGSVMVRASGPAVGEITGSDALHSRVRAELASFTNWLRTNGAQGYVGEVGWPNNADTGQWNTLAQAWYEDAAAAGLWVSNWSTGEWFGSSYKLSSYVWATQDGALAVARSPASVIEAQAETERAGVNVAGGEFGPLGTGLAPTSTLSNAKLGVYNKDYHYDKQESFNYLASRGIRTVRLPFRWERIQPNLGGPLDPTELGRLDAAVGRARSAGLDVILDLHNYAAYWLFDGTQGVRQAIGSAAVTQAHFADLWGRLSQQFATDPAVIAYGLMNEPVGIAPSSGFTSAQIWEQASQGALDAIRANGDTKLVMVPGYLWAGAQVFAAQHPKTWISDSAANFRYEVHHYFDRDNSGRYSYSYEAEVANAEARSYIGLPTTSTTAAPPSTTTTTVTLATTTPSSTTTNTVKPADTDTVAPSAPSNLEAKGARRKVVLSWSGSIDTGGSGVAGYEVWRATSASGPYALVASTASPSYQDVSVRKRVTYRYVVYAYDGSGNRSAASNIVFAKTS